MRVYWKDSLRFETADKQFTARIGGRIHFDMNYSSYDDALGADVGDDGNRWGFRRARLEASGTVYETIGYSAGYDVASGTAAFRNVYMELADFLSGALRVGQFKAPFSLEQLTSSNDITFMERSLADSLAPAYQMGVGYYGARMEDALNYAVAWTFTDSPSAGAAAGDGANSFFGRVAWANQESEESLLHLGGGLGYSGYASPTTYSTKLGVSLADDLDVTVPLDSSMQVGLEAAWVGGPLHAAAEFILEQGDGATGAVDVDSMGYYAQVGYFLTGESRPYKGGVFGRVQPKSDWKGVGNGSGAWELAARYSGASFDPDTPVATEVDVNSITLGANWYLNANARIMANYVLASVDNSAGGYDEDVSAFQLRFQVTF
ncbi:MAG TPA: porin [Planctomycetota bacterium]|nr:porin [Planctomycetota bacterium]